MDAKVSELREGQTVRVRGQARRAGGVVTSSLGKRTCFYWEVRGTLGEGSAMAREGVDFWLEDTTGRVLVRTDRVEADARAERQKRVLGQVDRDIHAVSARARVVKSAIQSNTGDAKALNAEKRRLAELATLLCAVRAHARGRVHTGGSLSGQRDYIAARAQKADAGVEYLALAIDEWEVTIQEGNEIEVEGVCVRGAAPGVSAGYRDAPTALTLCAPEGGTLKISGLGASSSESTPRTAGAAKADGARGAAAAEPAREARVDPSTARARERAATAIADAKAYDRKVLTITVTVMALGFLVAWWLTR